ncbi:MAG TPA: hypothetical protein VFJ58_08955 [Armatimonadota bacterium]|nr:hypothetical protein [Armatimonadota bacterium]
MSIQVTGIVRGTNAIEVDAPLPFEDGARVSVEIEPTADPDELIRAQDMLGRLRALVGIGGSGRGDVAQNKHRYLTGAYGIDNRPGIE